MKKQKNLIIGLILFAAFIAAAVFAYSKLSENYTLPQNNISQNSPGSDTLQNTSPEKDTAAQQEPQKIPAPDFTVFDGNGNAVTLSSFEGKPVVANFWATWCGPCKMELPAFENAYKKYGNKVAFLMVNLTDGTNETVPKVKEFIAQNGYTFPVYYDTQYSAAAAYGISSIPVTLFVDRNGAVHNGYISAMSEDLLFDYIDDLMGG